MKIDKSMITSEPKYPLAVRCSFISLDEDGTLKEAKDSLGVVLANLDSFVVNRILTIKEEEILAKNGFVITSKTIGYDDSTRKSVIEVHVERIHNRIN